jgi:aminoglycoside phosphotransferase (APT) family kinase protein
VDRQALFSGTETPLGHLAVDLDALADYLRPRIEGFGGPLAATKFKGGQSNPTYLLSSGSRRWVLRRRPPGKLIESAHAIDREYRVMGAVRGAGIPVPATYLYCEDDNVIGSQFYIVEYVHGRLFWDANLPDIAPAERSALYLAMASELARVHSLDFTAAGLAGFGGSGAYAGRNLARWSKIYDQSRLEDIPDMNWLMVALQALLPAKEPVTLIHGDYGLYNIIFWPDQPEVAAILDWEMATLGNPWIDLAHHLRAWWEPLDASGSATSLAAYDLDRLGIPSMDRYVALYAARCGLDVPTDLGFYLAFAQFRYAAMVQAVLKRAASGTAANRTMLHTQEKVYRIARLARQSLS